MQELNEPKFHTEGLVEGETMNLQWNQLARWHNILQQCLADQVLSHGSGWVTNFQQYAGPGMFQTRSINLAEVLEVKNDIQRRRTLSCLELESLSLTESCKGGL